MMRVKSYIQNRIPEVIDVVLSADSDIVDDNRLNTGGLF